MMPDQMSNDNGSSSSSSSSSNGRSSTGGNGSSYSSEFQWLYDALDMYGVKCSEKLLPVIALLREQEILTLKCFSFLTEEELEGLIGRLSLTTAGLKASLRAAHDESKARRKS